ncbi:MAG: aldehyde dehydrogenase family protein [Verrucomicrobia bacterium]|nr:aldehyde dehydrogenase family protein [Verrucomicrobiota bacterium]
MDTRPRPTVFLHQPGNRRTRLSNQKCGHLGSWSSIPRSRAAFREWAESSPEQRFQVARKFAGIVDRRREDFVTAISHETGKPLWESNQEVDTVLKKVDLSISAYIERTGYVRFYHDGREPVRLYFDYTLTDSHGRVVASGSDAATDVLYLGRYPTEVVELKYEDSFSRNRL